MKIILTILLILIATSAYAAKFRGTSEALRVPGTAVVQIFDNISTLNTAVSVNPAFLPDQGTIQLVLNGSPSTYDVVTECSLISDTGPWFAIMSMTQADSVLGKHYALKACPFVQIRLDTLDTGSVDAYIIYRGN